MNNSPSSPLLLILAAVAVLVLAPLAGHFVWPDIGWFFALLFALLTGLMVCTVWLVASTFHDPVRRWNLPPAPAVRGWRGGLARLGSAFGALAHKLRRGKPAG